MIGFGLMGKIRRGMTLIEVMVASIVLVLALLGLFMVNSSSSRMTMDSYFEFLTVQLAQEPLEVFRSVGYPACMSLARYPIGSPHPITNESGVYPVEATMFERKITVDTSRPPLCAVTVSVYPKINSMASAWFKKRKNTAVMKALIPFAQ